MSGINTSRDVINMVIGFNQNVNDFFDEKQNELNKITIQLKEDAQLLRNLRNELAKDKKTVDIRPIKDRIDHFRAQFNEIQHDLDAELKSKFDFDKLKLDKMDPEALQDLIDEIESAKAHLQNSVQPTIMEMEAKIQLMKLLTEIAKLILNQQTESVKNWIGHVGR